MFSPHSRNMADVDTLSALRQEWDIEQAGACNEDYLQWLEFRMSAISPVEPSNAGFLDQTLVVEQAWRSHPLHDLDRERLISREDLSALLGDDDLYRRHVAWLEFQSTASEQDPTRPLRTAYVQARSRLLPSLRAELSASGRSWSTADVTRYRMAFAAAACLMQQPASASLAGTAVLGAGTASASAQPGDAPTAVAGQPAVACASVAIGGTDQSHGQMPAGPPGGIQSTPTSSNRPSSVSARPAGRPVCGLARGARSLNFGAADLLPAPPSTMHAGLAPSVSGRGNPPALPVEIPSKRPSAGEKCVTAVADARASKRQAVNSSPVDMIGAHGNAPDTAPVRTHFGAGNQILVCV